MVEYTNRRSVVSCWIRALLLFSYRYRALLFAALGLALYYSYPVYESSLKGIRTGVLDRSAAVLDSMLKVSGRRLCPQHEFSAQRLSVRHSDTVMLRVLLEENTLLKRMLNFISNYSGVDYTTTRVLVACNGVKREPFIPLGRRDGIYEQQAIVNTSGLVGKTTEVGEHSARILLVTDKGFYIPVRIVDSGVVAILASSDDGMFLTHLSSEDVELRDGELVITEGGEGGFPHGIYVGSVFAQRRVVPAVNPDELDIVSVVSARKESKD